MWFIKSILLPGTALATLQVLNFSIPSSLPSNASPQLEPAPIGVSIEFFTFPEYMNNLTATITCLENFKTLTGTWPPVRVGGTTQDRATFNASSPNEVTYEVASPLDAPANLTFGPSFMSLANTYAGDVILGLNRRLDNQPNTIQAARKARKEMSNLLALELGNEPDLYSSEDPIAQGMDWTATADFESQISWQAALGTNLSIVDIVSAGVYLEVSSFNNSALAELESGSLKYVKDFCSHNYPQSPSNANLSVLMSHSAIASQIEQFEAEIEAAESRGKYHIMGETNSATGGGGGISPTFGAALWVMDYSIQMLIMGTKRLYFHQGTIGACPYCWWGQPGMGSPYSGAYFATLALAGADHVAPLDNFTSNYGAYAIYQNDKPIRALLYNSDYYTGGKRSSQSFSLRGVEGKSHVKAKRLTAASAVSEQAEGQAPKVGGQHFDNSTCAIKGTPHFEKTVVKDGEAIFIVGASEALLVYL